MSSSNIFGFDLDVSNLSDQLENAFDEDIFSFGQPGHQPNMGAVSQMVINGPQPSTLNASAHANFGQLNASLLANTAPTNGVHFTDIFPANGLLFTDQHINININHAAPNVAAQLMNGFQLGNGFPPVVAPSSGGGQRIARQPAPTSTVTNAMSSMASSASNGIPGWPFAFGDAGLANLIHQQQPMQLPASYTTQTRRVYPTITPTNRRSIHEPLPAGVRRSTIDASLVDRSMRMPMINTISGPLSAINPPNILQPPFMSLNAKPPPSPNSMQRINHETLNALLAKPLFPGLSSLNSNATKEKDLLTNFRLLQRIGSGTYGKVYKAKDRRNQHTVAIKRIHCEVQPEQAVSLFFVWNFPL